MDAIGKNHESATKTHFLDPSVLTAESVYQLLLLDAIGKNHESATKTHFSDPSVLTAESVYQLSLPSF